MDRRARLEQLREAIPIAELIGETVALTRRGRTLAGACTLHADPAGGLRVDDLHGSYLCFSCGRHGDVVRWTMEENKVPEGDAIGLLEAWRR